MQYERAFAIQRRLDEILRLIETGAYSTPALAEAIGVSVPTISRSVQALRERGHDIRAEKDGNGWRYTLTAKAVSGRKTGTHSSDVNPE